MPVAVPVLVLAPFAVAFSCRTTSLSVPGSYTLNLEPSTSLLWSSDVEHMSVSLGNPATTSTLESQPFCLVVSGILPREPRTLSCSERWTIKLLTKPLVEPVYNRAR